MIDLQKVKYNRQGDEILFTYVENDLIYYVAKKRKIPTSNNELDLSPLRLKAVFSSGRFHRFHEHRYDLIEEQPLQKDDYVLVWDNNNPTTRLRRFAEFVDGKITTYEDGVDSIISNHYGWKPQSWDNWERYYP